MQLSSTNLIITNSYITQLNIFTMIQSSGFEKRLWCPCIPTVETQSIRTEAAEETAATGNGPKGNVGED
ncbi:hypothetical protein A2U01_0021274 [Trifolium medium]|uniref:Uncharacterized protein n=1 Tax=Trifolium medium TaxID=97028 RepID=A0A392NK31_9FABA|nr:hypothetical protein [Trifolium medium]